MRMKSEFEREIFETDCGLYLGSISNSFEKIPKLWAFRSSIRNALLFIGMTIGRVKIFTPRFFQVSKVKIFNGKRNSALHG
jgi:hypothetical protein